MPTDYSSPQFAHRYAKSRQLSAAESNLWLRECAAATAGGDGGVVLDLGAGVGRFWPVLQAAWRPRLILALDQSEVMLRRANSRQGIVRVVAEMDQLPFRRGSLDVCFCSMAMHYSRDPVGLTGQLAQLLRPGGRLCIRTGTKQTLPSLAFLRYFPTAHAAEVRAMPSESEVVAWLEAHQLEVLIDHDVSGPPVSSRRRYFVRVAARGFPSMQFVPSHEFAQGVTRLATRLVVDWILRRPLHGESARFVVAKRRAT